MTFIPVFGLICLPPNSTHLTQPLDKAVFGPIKRVWRSTLTQWKMKRNRSGETLPKEEFPKLLKELVSSLQPNVEQNTISGFRACGTSQLDRQEVLKNIPPTSRPAGETAALNQSLLDHLTAQQSFSKIKFL